VVTPFPGGVGISGLRVYDWPTVDGVCGGSPHVHLTCAECYYVIGGQGSVQTLTRRGFAETQLREGTVAWFTPGTIHRLVNDGDLRIIVVMQNSGLPEAGDAVFTFPPEILADPAAYAEAASLPATSDPDELAAAARQRRDLAIAGYLTLRERVQAEGPQALEPLYQAAATLVAGRVETWRELWRSGPLTQAVNTGDHLDALAAGKAPYLAFSGVHTASPVTGKFGMCGHLTGWELR
jgi:mannose-6-phosphate isomerase-like protein (cupin superfamily)